MTTFSMLAPAAGQTFAPLSGTSYTADAKGLVTAVALADVRDLVAAGCVPLGTASLSDAAIWNTDQTAPQVLAAVGATKGAAGVVTKNRVQLSATASTEGVILKAVATGAETSLFIPGTIGAKIYPPANGTLDASATNAAVVLAAGKGITYIQTGATTFKTKLKSA